MGSLCGADCSECNLKSECAGLILISSYSADGSQPEIVLYKIKLKLKNRRRTVVFEVNPKV